LRFSTSSNPTPDRRGLRPGTRLRAAERLEEIDFGEGGLGIAIIRAIVDDLEISEKMGGGSRLRFVKRLDS